VPVEELICQELVEVVTEYLEGSLAPSRRIEFEKHLVMCDGCAAYLDQMRQTIRLTGRLGAEDVPAGGRDALLRVFRDWKQSQ
jgi:anti-sigma factor RsiW